MLNSVHYLFSKLMQSLQTYVCCVFDNHLSHVYTCTGKQCRSKACLHCDSVAHRPISQAWRGPARIRPAALPCSLDAALTCFPEHSVFCSLSSHKKQRNEHSDITACMLMAQDKLRETAAACQKRSWQEAAEDHGREGDQLGCCCRCGHRRAHADPG